MDGTVEEDGEDAFGRLEASDTDPIEEEEDLPQYNEPPKLTTQIGQVKVETQGGPEEDSLQDITAIHRWALTRALEKAGNYPGML